MAGKYYFDEAAADRAVKFFENEIVHVKGELAGQPLVLEPWQKDDLIRPLLGWKDKQTGLRRYRVVYLFVPRKNGKSFIAAGLGLYLLFADKEPGAEILCAATDIPQANYVYDICKENVLRNAKLSALGEPYKRAIVVRRTASYLMVVSSEASNKHGGNLHAFILDELHEQKNRELMDVLSTGTGARRQPLEIYITTAGYDKRSAAYEMHDYALKVRDGIIEDEQFLPLIYCADEDDDWTKEETWKKANPNYGVSIYPEYFKKQAQKAIDMPSYENTFKRLHLNLWTEQDTRWIPMTKWDDCREDFTAKDLEGATCFAGLDLSSTTDVSALTLVFPDAEFKNYKCLAYYWVPSENMRQRSRRDKVPYVSWHKKGKIRATSGNIIDYDRIRNDIVKLGEQFNIKEIAIDRWNATQIATQLDGDGFNICMFGQGYASMSAPSKELEALLYSKRLKHNGDPVLRWMASNVAVETDAAGNVKPSKKKSIERIDGIVSLIMGVGRCAVHKPDKPSIYTKERGFTKL